jgi:acyl-CoA synthetase (AMP-forming)/AMP-acid ligase II
MPWVEAEAVDSEGTPLPAGKEGIIRFRCEEMALSYLNDEAGTADFFRDGWFYPGDLGSIDAARAMTITGRSTERINAGGVKIAPGLIERALLEFEGVEDCAAFGVPNRQGIENIWAAIVANKKIDLDALRKYCGTKLGDNSPREFLVLDELPRTETGKIRRGDLLVLASESARAKSAGSEIKPQNHSASGG